jgi:hypothetical protein
MPSISRSIIPAPSIRFPLRAPAFWISFIYRQRPPVDAGRSRMRGFTARAKRKARTAHLSRRARKPDADASLPVSAAVLPFVMHSACFFARTLRFERTAFFPFRGNSLRAGAGPRPGHVDSR